ncbi:DUF3613 domain-containing protein [Pseudomonas triticifolii]|uniref:DUF3613 domain-containing protein n=1 Tax=Pseudomonas triticifolii TaxID=2762592 RepID=A0ABR7BIH7_9PSED|nr:DUF3613 domain-containing protein [Pseudomonas triticifolii]MBC3956962.1 DUF3613 domain-containing protein [Pseudomonas triticifolii]
MKRILLCGAVLLAFSTDTLASDSSSTTTQPQTQTETWLKLQAKGTASSPTPQTSTPAERDLSLQRWLESYKYKIPEFFDQETGGSFASQQ